jgi:hypothetical protein
VTHEPLRDRDVDVIDFDRSERAQQPPYFPTREPLPQRVLVRVSDIRERERRDVRYEIGDIATIAIAPEPRSRPGDALIAVVSGELSVGDRTRPACCAVTDATYAQRIPLADLSRR